ncbi:gamma-glutamyltransferase [Pigmentibacter sp. JX0631]|uniref:gamma-glutamyltransferase n=1 Tax=Pigmentibacter sp. JX0631 TaxID=2976982 RepID=UPI0024685B27|nr:gamma-glutamyltransferase [Pigmentibacter sp. JX0631]WGL58897.1 gamma-glutamyltransferase [Pigmentibacter sp. JX0631]
MKKISYFLLKILLINSVNINYAFPLIDATQFQNIEKNTEIYKPIFGRNGIVVSEEEMASKIGVEILRQGGNAIDAAVAVGFALAVTFPEAGNIGGGGFMMIWLNKEKKAININYREKAPFLATKNMFLKANGNIDNDKLDKSYLSTGVPGTVMGLTYALKKYGKLPLDKVIKPAIDLAENGFIVSHALSQSLIDSEKLLSTSNETKKIFFNNGKPIKVGDNLIQHDLAKTLKIISELGSDGFYKGEIAKKIVDDMKANGGIISLEDLSNYNVEEQTPIHGKYKNYNIYSVPPPSSGGVTIIEMLNILENFDLKKYPLNSAKYFHLMNEIMSYAYFDRNNKLGDPNFVKNPLDLLTNKEYSKLLAKKINLSTHTPSSKIESSKNSKKEEINTTHFSIIDSEGNMVSNTYTLNFSFGNGKVVKGAGFILNNEMGDFTAKIGSANSYGLVQGEKNIIAPQKRPLSSMSPTILLNDKSEPILVVGAPGGSRIISQVFNFLVRYIDYHKNIATCIATPKFHNQLWPDIFFYEEGTSPDTLEKMVKMGHKIKLSEPFGSLQAAEVKELNKQYFGFTDPRTEGGAAIGFFQ